MWSAVLREAVADDADAAALVWWNSFTAALPTVRPVHDLADVRRWVRDVLIAEHETWVAEAQGRVVGLLTLGDGELEQLYVLPDWRGRGLGDRFVALATQRRPGGLGLWTFQVNAPARRFYARHGFVETRRTDGRGNEEREPDVRLEWRPGSRWGRAVRT